jgi:hypothetical protein
MTNTYNCEKCDYKTNITVRWNRHLNTELHKTGIRKKRSDTKNPLKCNFCEYESKNKTTFTKHILNKHSTKDERLKKFKFYCHLCDYGTFSIDSFNMHNETEKHKMVIKIVNNIKQETL